MPDKHVQPTAAPMLRTAAAGIVATTVANAVVGLLLRKAFDISTEFRGLMPQAIISVTVLALVAGVGLLTLLRRRSVGAERLFSIVATALALVSCAAPLALLAGNASSTPGWSRAAALSLLPLHLIPLAGALAIQRKTSAAPRSLVPA